MDRAAMRERMDAMKQRLSAGVQVVAAPQLFPTPAALAGRMVDEADIQRFEHVGEFSAGTGRILAAIAAAIDLAEIRVTAVEINQNLARALRDRYQLARMVCADFLACGAELGEFDKIVINPPFANGQDIAHISHALGYLKPRGRLVAICANGPRQQQTLRPMVEDCGGLWEELPDDTFEESGTRVRTVLLTIDR
jgi:protein-L-isoaspartate O-methyltransferase